jgi:deoxyribonuclease V
VVVIRLPGLEKVEECWARGLSDFPYIPGLLGFREIPVLIQALKRLETSPELFLCDGHGIAHPRRMGLAAHLGLILDRPAIGCAKSRLVGEFSLPAPEKGSRSELRLDGEAVGAVLRTRGGVKPLYVSPGHRIEINGAVRLVLACCAGYRIPEPLRQAHILVNRLRRAEGAE